MSSVLDLVYYKSDKGVYVSTDKFDYTGTRCPLNGYSTINNKAVLPTHLRGWVLIPGESEVLSIQNKRHGGYSNPRWELIEESLESDKFPKILTNEDVGSWGDDDGDVCWGDGSPYKHLRSLYEFKQDPNPEVIVELEFNAKYLGEIRSEDVENVSTAKYKILKPDGWKKEEQEVNLSDIAHYYEIEQMLVADLLLHNRPCYLSSENTYDIVRNYIKNNINPQYATITSDYDFCFTVKKKIATKPVTTKSELLTSRGKSYKPPRFKTSTVSHKQVEVFEMTSAKSRYGDYSVIEGFKGDSLEDLAINIKTFLDELTTYINSPLSECECCNGTGHIFEDNFQLNKRG